MKGFITRSIVALCCMFAFCINANAGSDTPIDVSQLPALSQKIIKTHFSKCKVAMAKMESGIFDKSYDVVFTNGSKIEFDAKGNWKEIESKRHGVPNAIVPEPIRKYLKSHYPHKKVLKIERDRKGYEIELSNGLDIKFNKSFEVTEID